MILKYFSEYLKQTDNYPSFEILFLWIKDKLEKPAKCHQDKVIQAEIYLAENEQGSFCLIGNSDTGRKLVQSLYYYITGCQNLHDARKKHLAKSRKYDN